jgi:hypothetical protein
MNSCRNFLWPSAAKAGNISLRIMGIPEISKGLALSCQSPIAMNEIITAYGFSDILFT